MNRAQRAVIVTTFALAAASRSSAADTSAVTALALPGAPADGVALDYLAVDHAGNRVWVPAGGTGSANVIDTKTRTMRRVEGFPTTEVERNGKKRMVGPSSATLGDGIVYVGNRADSTVCAIDSKSLTRGACVTLPSMPDGLAYIAHTKEVWATTPRDQSIVVLDVSKPGEPKISGTIKLEGDPEGYAVDGNHGVFYTNLEDKDKTLRIDVRLRKPVATWNPSCGEAGPRGLAVEPDGHFLVVACTDHVEVLDTRRDGAIVSKLDTGQGVDNIDYLAARHLLFAAAGGAAKLTVASLDAKGTLTLRGSAPTAKGARNAVATADGTAYVADGPEGKILIVKLPG